MENLQYLMNTVIAFLPKDLDTMKAQFDVIVEASKTFVGEIVWQDPIIVGALSIVFVLFMTVFMIRKSLVLLVVYALLLLGAALAPLAAHTRLAEIEVLKQAPIASKDYFQPEGIFVFLFTSVPCILIAVLAIFMSYIRVIMAIRHSSQYQKVMQRGATGPVSCPTKLPEPVKADKVENKTEPAKKKGKKNGRSKKLD